MIPIHEDPDRVSYLFDVAHREAGAEIMELSAEERAELSQIRALLDVIDASWQAPTLERDRVRTLFLQKLAAKTPDHPWVRGNIVRTLGDLIQASTDDVPTLPSASYAELEKDATPVEALLDPVQRTVAVGQALRRAAVPQTIVGEFVLWLNRVLAELVPQSGAMSSGLIFTRRQGGRRAREQ